jgi:hypothetical protein
MGNNKLAAATSERRAYALIEVGMWIFLKKVDRA